MKAIVLNREQAAKTYATHMLERLSLDVQDADAACISMSEVMDDMELFVKEMRALLTMGSPGFAQLRSMCRQGCSSMLIPCKEFHEIEIANADDQEFVVVVRDDLSGDVIGALGKNDVVY